MTDQPLEAESLLTLYALLAAIADPVRKLSSVFTRIQAGCAAADRVFSYLDLPVEGDRQHAAGIGLERHHESIEFRDVCFSYDPGHPILTDVASARRVRRNHRPGRQERLRQIDHRRPVARASSIPITAAS